MPTPLLHSVSSDLRLARELADVADAVTMAHFAKRDLAVFTKPDRTPVTEADRATEQAIRARLTEARPSDSIFGEEFGTSGEARRQWIVDPIDGTANYMRGIPIWASLISLVVDGEPRVGVVSAPALGRRWWGASGHGAYLSESVSTHDTTSERPLRVSGVETLEEASISYNSLKGWDDAGRLPELVALSRRVGRTRAVGEFWSYMLVAEGALEIAGEFDLQPYDMAAIIPIVTEAGGRFSSVDGEPGPWHGSALATNGALHDQALEALAARG